MPAFDYRRGRLFAEQVPLAAIAEAQGTPTYVYSTQALRESFGALESALAHVPHLVCYSVKANSSLAILSLFSQWGAGFDIVSGGELQRVRQVNGSAARMVFAGVGKTQEEMAQALAAGILLFNVESAEELDALDAVARAQGKRAPFAIRVNPDVDARTHRYIATGLQTSKFGVPLTEAAALYARSRRMKGLLARGVDCHIGSQLTQLSPIRKAMRKVSDFYVAQRAKGHALTLLDVGGGLGITYTHEKPPSMGQYGRVLAQVAKETGARILLEPGRSLVGNAGVLLTRVLYRKPTARKHFVVVDAGMNDLIRPALYEAHHDIWPVQKTRRRPEPLEVVGPVCESSDVLARARPMAVPRQGDLWAIRSVGAYGMSMASSYNSRPRAAEILVEGAAYRVIRAREAVSDLWRGESL